MAGRPAVLDTGDRQERKWPPCRIMSAELGWLLGWLAGWRRAPCMGRLEDADGTWLLVRSSALVLSCSSALPDWPAWPGWTITTLFPPSPTGRRLVFLLRRNPSGSALARVDESAGPQPLRTLLRGHRPVTAPETKTVDGRGCWGDGRDIVDSWSASHASGPPAAMLVDSRG